VTNFRWYFYCKWSGRWRK